MVGAAVHRGGSLHILIQALSWIVGLGTVDCCDVVPLPRSDQVRDSMKWQGGGCSRPGDVTGCREPGLQGALQRARSGFSRQLHHVKALQAVENRKKSGCGRPHVEKMA